MALAETERRNQAVNRLPHGSGIDDHHCELLRDAAESRCVEITVPLNLASQPADAAVSARTNQQAQSLFEDRALGTRAAGPHRLAHQVIVDIDVRPHVAL